MRYWVWKMIFIFIFMGNIILFNFSLRFYLCYVGEIVREGSFEEIGFYLIVRGLGLLWLEKKYYSIVVDDGFVLI